MLLLKTELYRITRGDRDYLTSLKGFMGSRPPDGSNLVRLMWMMCKRWAKYVGGVNIKATDAAPSILKKCV